MRRKGILLRVYAPTPGKRDFDKHLFDIHTLDPTGNGGWLRYPKKTGQTPVRSLPRKENGKARTWMDEKSVRKSHGQHIPPAKGMDERALLLLGLLSLLTAADEVRHADAQHRATGDPSESHAVKAGQREAHGLGVADIDGDLAGISVGAGVFLTMKSIVADITVKLAEGDVGALLVCLRHLCLKGLHLHRVFVIRRGDDEGEGVGLGGVLGRVGGLDLSHLVGAGVEVGNGDLAFFVGRELHTLGKVFSIGDGHELTRDDTDAINSTLRRGNIRGFGSLCDKGLA